MNSVALSMFGIVLAVTLYQSGGANPNGGADPNAIKECSEQGMCYWKGECKAPGRRRKWRSQEECARMWCHSYRLRKFLAIRMDRFYGCPYNGQCKRKNEEWVEEGCVKKKCHMEGPRGYERIITVSELGCRDSSGKCHFPGSTWEEDCIKYQCLNHRNATTVRAVYDVIEIGCPFNETCLKNGAVVPDTESKCTSLRCVGVQGEDRSIHYGMQTDQIKCEDANGLCREEGERGWSLYVNGTLYNNCHCNIVREEGRATSIQKECS
uniref:Uncharacterized protein LOC111111699 isoform X2 n=1 Tax=Crassostrea virginica TaxID=6565 RepID=A0A8B8BNR1_CRAVI|nr:uncharacterized protein LOC111111699 isoform X2 [Crassostrea virginica]